MSDEMNPLLMNQAPQGDAYLYRALYHLGTQMADALRAYEENQGEEDEEEYDEDDEEIAEERPDVKLPTADWAVVSVETLTFNSLQERYGSESLWGVLQFTEQPGGLFVTLDHSTAKVLTGVPTHRRFTDDMLDTADEIVRRISEVFASTWAEIMSECENQHGTFPEMPDLSELQEIFMGLAANTPFVVTTFRTSVPSQPMGRVMLSLPQSYLVPYADSLKVAADNTYVRTAGEDVDARLRYIGDSPVPVVAYLGQTSMTVSELHGLEEEDVIVLDQEINAPLTVELGGGRVLAKPGTSADGTRKAVQIVRLGVD